MADNRTRADDPAGAAAEDPLIRAEAAHRAGALDVAEPLYRAALAADPGSARAWTNLGVLLRQNGRPGPALGAHQKARELEPASALILSNLAGALDDLQRYDEVLAIRRALHKAFPDDLQALANLTSALTRVGRFDEVIELVDRAEATHGADAIPRAMLQRAFGHLVKGAYGPGFRDAEARIAAGEVGLPKNSPWPLWDGQDPAGKRIGVLAEQGLGDTIVMARFLPELAARGARVVFDVQKPLARLFAGLEGVERQLRGIPQNERLDAYVPSASLPHRLGIGPGGPPPPPHLTIPEDSRRRARAIIAPYAGRMKVGVVWTGSTTNSINRRRSASPEDYLGLATLPGVQLFSLYKGPDHAKFLASGMAGLIVDACGDDRDMADAAGVIDAMDLVIANDTGVVHVAGSLGKPVWTLLDSVGFWLYGLEETTPWYPSMRLFRQRRPGDWREVFARVEAALRDRLERRQ